MAKIITYDLCNPGKNYSGLINRIKDYKHCKITESCWIVSTSWSCIQIRDDLSKYLDNNDRLFVAELTGVAAWKGLMLDSNDNIKKILNQ